VLKFDHFSNRCPFFVSFVRSFENWGWRWASWGTTPLLPPFANKHDGPDLVPSFPHAFSGNPGEFGTGPPIRTFGGDAFSSSVGERKLMTHFVVIFVFSFLVAA